jgi:fibronectin type 3 domain-containing protein
VLAGACVLAAGCGDDPVSPVEDEAPILPPTNVSSITSDAEKLLITWEPNTHPHLKGYHVYRLETATQEAVRLTTEPVLAPEYRDPQARRGVEYEYRVTAITTAGKESMYTSVMVFLQAQTSDQGETYHGAEL